MIKGTIGKGNKDFSIIITGMPIFRNYSVISLTLSR